MYAFYKYNYTFLLFYDVLLYVSSSSGQNSICNWKQMQYIVTADKLKHSIANYWEYKAMV